MNVSCIHKDCLHSVGCKENCAGTKYTESAITPTYREMGLIPISKGQIITYRMVKKSHSSPHQRNKS